MPVMRSAISFGLVTVPVVLEKATVDHSVSFRQIHAVEGCGGRIRYRKICELDGQELRADEIGRAYETATGDLVEVTDQDLDGLPLATVRAIEIVSFVPADTIDPLRIGSATYFLTCSDPVAAKPYTLIKQALDRSQKVAIAKFSLRGDRERLGLLRVIGPAIALHVMRWPDELRDPAGLAPKSKVRLTDEELAEAEHLIESLSDVDIDQLRDTYRDALEEVIAAKHEGRPLEPAETEVEPAGQVVDLMAALQDSVRKAQEGRGEGTKASVHELAPKPAKKAAAKRAAGKKTATKKTTAKKASAGTKRSA
ncbi:Ku protein [Streptomyces sp. N35]|uniref:non-homologous end joining protein Ku n=1 Tax=Streptomyces sp. N35 TaxID=2795730 RepID=UPI0018F4B0A7|nr:Ku protein [Streptomyces sp. N35]